MSRARSLAEQIASRCVHFTGIGNSPTCKAGVAYAAVRLEHPPIQYDGKYTATVSHPCLSHHNHGGATCAKAQFPTPEEVQAEVEASGRRFGQVVTARQAITTHSGSKRGVAGELPCPVCTTGTLRYSIAGSNGHCHARCSTGGCVSWME